MRCPKCKRDGSCVLQTDQLPDRIRRRRICYACGFRWWTTEQVATKKGGAWEWIKTWLS